MSCPLCNAISVKDIFTKDSAAFKKCTECSFVFSVPDHNVNFQESIEDYNDAYVQYLENNIADDSNFRSILDFINKYSEIKKASVLDVGCGSGKFVRYLRKNSAYATGIEPSKALYTKYLNNEATFANLTIEEYAQSTDKRHNVITLCDVIEHVENPRSFLQTISSLIDSNGLVFLETVDVDSPVARVCGRHWHFYHKYHLSYLSKKTLTDLCELTGFEIITWYRPKVYFPVGYIFRYIIDLFVHRKNVFNIALFDNMLISLNTGDRFRALLRKKTITQNKFP